MQAAWRAPQVAMNITPSRSPITARITGSDAFDEGPIARCGMRGTIRLPGGAVIGGGDICEGCIIGAEPGCTVSGGYCGACCAEGYVSA